MNPPAGHVPPVSLTVLLTSPCNLPLQLAGGGGARHGRDGAQLHTGRKRRHGPGARHPARLASSKAPGAADNPVLLTHACCSPLLFTGQRHRQPAQAVLQHSAQVLGLAPPARLASAATSPVACPWCCQPCSVGWQQAWQGRALCCRAAVAVQPASCVPQPLPWARPCLPCSGGSTMYGGIASRLEKELRQLYQDRCAWGCLGCCNACSVAWARGYGQVGHARVGLLRQEASTSSSRVRCTARSTLMHVPESEVTNSSASQHLLCACPGCCAATRRGCAGSS